MRRPQQAKKETKLTNKDMAHNPQVPVNTGAVLFWSQLLMPTRVWWDPQLAWWDPQLALLFL